MNIAGTITSSATPAQLHGLGSDRDRLDGVGVLSELVIDGDGLVRGRFTPTTVISGTTFDVVIRAGRVDAESAQLSISGRHGPHRVDVALTIAYAPTGDGSQVSWSADVVVRGPLASVGQRVVGDLATRAIREVLEQAAAVARA
jgi:carbon monoxide dehydrogenase subunit G